MNKERSMHNLGTVFRFEVSRTLKKKSFWLVSLLFPVMFAVIVGIIYFSNKATDAASEKSAHQKFSIQVTDESGLIHTDNLNSSNIKTVTKEKGIANVQSGRVDAYFYYPKDLTKDKVEVYGKDLGIFNNGRYNTAATGLLDASVRPDIDPNVATIVSNKLGVSATTYRDGKKYNPILEMIAPAIFLILFYILISTFGSQMLTSTTEEKENRVIEMILTTIEAKTLIIGKILALVVLGFIQMLVVMLPVLLGYLVLHDKLSLPSIDLSTIPLDPIRIIMGFAIFITSFVMFTGLLVAIGSATPTAKEAGSFFGVVMMLIFGPLYAAPLFITSPESGIVQFLSYFPLTAPIPLLLRNAVGTLGVTEAVIALVILGVTSIVILQLGVRTFTSGALEYSRRLSLKEIFRREA